MLVLAVATVRLGHRSATPPWATRSRSVGALGFGAWIGVVALVFGGRRVPPRARPRAGAAGGDRRRRDARAGSPTAYGAASARAVREPQPVPLDGRPPAARRRSTTGPSLVPRRSSASSCSRSASSLFVRRDLGVTPASRAEAARRSSSASAGRARAVRRHAAARRLVGDRHGPDGRVLAALVGAVVGETLKGDAGHPRDRSRRSSRTSTSTGPGLAPAVRRADVHRGRLRRRRRSSARWASDETDDRLEVLLATPMRAPPGCRRRRSALLAAVAVTTVLFAHRHRARRAPAGSTRREHARDARSGLLRAAIVGIGFAVGGLWRTSLAAEIAALRRGGHVPHRPARRRPLGLPDWSTSSR